MRRFRAGEECPSHPGNTVDDCEPCEATVRRAERWGDGDEWRAEQDCYERRLGGDY